MSWIFVVLMILGFIVLVYVILTFSNRERIYRHWNEFIADQCSYQNEVDRAFRNIPSLQNAWICQNEYVKEMHRSIFLLHSDLLITVEDYFKATIECAEEDADLKPMLPDNIGYQRKGGTRYFPFLINREPTSLVETFGLSHLQTPAFNFGLLLLEPGAVTPWRRNVSQGLYRYHYALKLPKEGEFGLYLRERHPDETGMIKEEIPSHRIKWREKQGFIWDASFDHHLANRSQEPCFLLVADIPRHLSWKHQWINTLLHAYFPPSDFSTISE